MMARSPNKHCAFMLYPPLAYFLEKSMLTSPNEMDFAQKPTSAIYTKYNIGGNPKQEPSYLRSARSEGMDPYSSHHATPNGMVDSIFFSIPGVSANRRKIMLRQPARGLGAFFKLGNASHQLSRVLQLIDAAACLDPLPVGFLKETSLRGSENQGL